MCCQNSPGHGEMTDRFTNQFDSSGLLSFYTGIVEMVHSVNVFCILSKSLGAYIFCKTWHFNDGESGRLDFAGIL